MAADPPKIYAIDAEGLRNVARHSSGGGNDGGNMNERVARLETHFEYIRRDLDGIKATLMLLPTLATKRDLVTWAGIYFVIAGMIVAGIIGGLSWIKPDLSLPTPVIIQGPVSPEVVPDTSTASPPRPE